MLRVTSNAKQVAARIDKAFRSIPADLGKNLGHYENIMRRGIQSHFERLGRGGSDHSALGAPVSWPAMERKVREFYGPDVPPLLHGRKRKLVNDWTGRAGALPLGPSGLRFGVIGDSNLSALMNVHQHGGQPLPDFMNSRKIFGTIPARPSVYWDRAMEHNVMLGLKAAFERNFVGGRK